MPTQMTGGEDVEVSDLGISQLECILLSRIKEEPGGVAGSLLETFMAIGCQFKEDDAAHVEAQRRKIKTS